MSYDDQLAQVEGYGEKLDKQHAEAPTAEQRTAQWLQERVGHCTASNFHSVLDRTKTGTEGAKRRNYRAKLTVERIINEPVSGFVNAAMEWGTAQESQARMAYEARTGAMIEEVGFIHHPTLKWVGGSPDGLIGKDGMIECKCPFEPAVHVSVLLTKECEHLPQIQGLLWITGRQWCDYVSYDPRMPAGLEIYVQRITRDDKFIADLTTAVIAFLAEVAAQHEALLEIAAQNTHSTVDTDTGEITNPVPPQAQQPADLLPAGPVGGADPKAAAETPCIYDEAKARNGVTTPYATPAGNKRTGEDRADGEHLVPAQFPSAAPHIQRIKTALHYGGGLLGKRFAAKLAASGIKSIDAIPESNHRRCSTGWTRISIRRQRHDQLQSLRCQRNLASRPER